MKPLYNEKHSVAFLQSRFIKTYSVILRCLNEVFTRDPSYIPKDILDYGAGVGSGALASHKLYNNKIKNIDCVEPSKYMRKIGK